MSCSKIDHRMTGEYRPGSALEQIQSYHHVRRFLAQYCKEDAKIQPLVIPREMAHSPDFLPLRQCHAVNAMPWGLFPGS